MKKLLVIALVLGVALGVFAGGFKGGFRPGPVNPPRFDAKVVEPKEFTWRERFGYEKGLGATLRVQDREQLKEQLRLHFRTRIAEAVNEMGLSKEQLEKIYNAAKDTRENLKRLANEISETQKQYYEALVKRDTEKVKELREKLVNLSNSVRDTYKKYYDTVSDIVTVGQLNRLRLWRVDCRGFATVFLTDEGFEVLEDFLK